MVVFLIILAGGVLFFSLRFFSPRFTANIFSSKNGFNLFFYSIRHSSELKQENLELQAKVSTLESYEAENIDLKEKLALLEEDSGVKIPDTFTSLLTKIIPSPTLFNSAERFITIGSSEGVQMNDLIMAFGSLVGKVIDVSKHSSKILLLHHKESVFKVELPGKKFATLSGIIEPQRLFLSEIPRDAVVEKGVKVQLASSIEYPERVPLLIGEVIEVIDIKEEPFLKAYVKPYVDYEFLEDVFVLSDSKN